MRGKSQLFFLSFEDRLGASYPFEMKFNLQDIIKRIEGLEQLPFSREEINKMIKEMPADRTPGLDGFTKVFLKAYWPIIKDDFLNYMIDL